MVNIKKALVIIFLILLILLATNAAAESKLKFKDITAYVDGDKNRGVDEDGGDLDKVKPNSTILLKFELENTYTRSEDIEIEDIEVEVVIEDIDDGDDIDETSREVDIDADDDQVVEIEIQIPLEVEDGKFDMVVTAEGRAKDENRTRHNVSVDIEIDIEKEDHELIFTDLRLIPNTIDCSRNTEVRFNLVNIGTDNEEGEVSIQSSELGIFQSRDFDLDEDPFDSDSQYRDFIPLTIKENAKPGTYQLRVNALFNRGRDAESGLVTLTINPCGEDTEDKISTPDKDKADKDKKDDIKVPVITEEDILKKLNISIPTSQVVKTQFVREPTDTKFTLGIILAEIIIIFIGAIIVALIMRPRRRID